MRRALAVAGMLGGALVACGPGEGGSGPSGAVQRGGRAAMITEILEPETLFTVSVDGTAYVTSTSAGTRREATPCTDSRFAKIILGATYSKSQGLPIADRSYDEHLGEIG